MDVKTRKYISRTGTVPEEDSGISMIAAPEQLIGQKFGNKERKYVNNSKDLPGFESGLSQYINQAKNSLSPGGTLLNPNPNANLNSDVVKADIASKVEIPSKKPNLFGKIANGIANNAQNMIGVANAANQIFGMSKATVTADELFSTAQSNSSTQNVGGVTYEKLGEVNDAAAHVDTAAGALGGAAACASAGAAFGPWGAAIGGVLGGVGGFFSSSSKKREMEARLREAKLRRQTINADRYNDAMAQYLQNEAMEEYGNQSNQSLYQAEEGKPSNMPLGTKVLNKKMEIFTPWGKTYGKPNVRLDAGEEVVLNDGTTFSIPNNNKYKGDKAYSYIPPQLLRDAFIASNKSELSFDDISPAQKVRYAKSIGELPNMINDIEEEQNMANMYRKSNTNKYNRIPGFGGGKQSFKDYWNKLDIDNIIPTVAGLGMAMNQYKEANEPLSTVNTYAQNLYQQAALDKLASLNQDPRPIYQANREAESRAANAIAQSGGYSAAQRGRMLANLAAQTQAANAKAKFDSDATNNQLATHWADSALQSGGVSAQHRQQAKQYDYEMLARAHNAALQGRQLATMYNAQNVLNQYFANRFKKKQFDETMDLYKKDQEINLQTLQAMLKGLKNEPSQAEKVEAVQSINPTYSMYLPQSPLYNPQAMFGDIKLQYPLPYEFLRYGITRNPMFFRTKKGGSK